MLGIFPYDTGKNLGKAYNEAMSKLDGWVLIKDYDILILLPETIRQIEHYTTIYPETGLFTCYTNRIANSEQLLNGMDNNDSIRHHMKLARQQQSELYTVTELTKPVSGMLMVIHTDTWNEIKFSEDLLCLGVDNDYHNRLKEAGKSVLRMNGIYVWHTYRLASGIKDKSHLV